MSQLDALLALIVGFLRAWGLPLDGEPTGRRGVNRPRGAASTAGIVPAEVAGWVAVLRREGARVPAYAYARRVDPPSRPCRDTR